MSAVRIRTATRADRGAVTGLLVGLSQESAYRRFQTSLGPAPRPAVVDALLPDSRHGGAVLAYDGAAVVGHGVWRRAGSLPVAEIGLVVADAHQGRGIGSAMAEALLADLGARGVERVEVFATATNEAVARMVERRAPGAVRERDGATVTYVFSTGMAERRFAQRTGSPTTVSSGPRRRTAA